MDFFLDLPQDVQWVLLDTLYQSCPVAIIILSNVNSSYLKTTSRFVLQNNLSLSHRVCYTDVISEEYQWLYQWFDIVESAYAKFKGDFVLNEPVLKLGQQICLTIVGENLNAYEGIPPSYWIKEEEINPFTRMLPILTEAHDEIYRNAYALCKLHKEGIKSTSHAFCQQIAEFTFKHYPSIFRNSKMAQWYLQKYLLNKYDNAYLFIRCALARGDVFNFKECPMWRTDTPESGHKYDSESKTNNKLIKSLFGGFKKHKKCIVIKLPNNNVVNMPLIANISDETSKKLDLIPNIDFKMYHLMYCYMCNKSAIEPYSTIKIKEEVPKPEIPTV